MQHLMSLEEATTKWNVSKRTVRQWCINGSINAVNIDGTWVINRNQQTPIQSLEEFKVSGLINAVNHFNEHYDVARIYFDYDNHSVWTAFYTNEDEMESYNHLSAIEIYNKLFNEEFGRQVTKEQVFMLCYDEYLTKKYASFDDFPEIIFTDVID